MKKLIFVLCMMILLTITACKDEDDNLYYRVHTDADIYYIESKELIEITDGLEYWRSTTLYIYYGKYEIVNSGDSVTIYHDQNARLWVKRTDIKNEVD